MKIKINKQFLLDLTVNCFFTLVSMILIQFIIPKGLTSEFLFRGSKLIGLIFIFLSIIFLSYWFFDKNFKFKKKISYPEIKDFILLCLPMSPIVGYIILNREYLNNFGLIYVILVPLVFIIILCFIIPILMSYIASLKMLMISGLAISFTVLSMSIITENPQNHIFNSKFITQGSCLIITFITVYLIYSFNKTIAYTAVVVFFLSGVTQKTFHVVFSKNLTANQTDNRLDIFLDNKNNKIIKKKNIYILVYESYANLETTKWYGGTIKDNVVDVTAETGAFETCVPRDGYNWRNAAFSNRQRSPNGFQQSFLTDGAVAFSDFKRGSHHFLVGCSQKENSATELKDKEIQVWKRSSVSEHYVLVQQLKLEQCAGVDTVITKDGRIFVAFLSHRGKSSGDPHPPDCTAGGDSAFTVPWSDCLGWLTNSPIYEAKGPDEAPLVLIQRITTKAPSYHGVDFHTFDDGRTFLVTNNWGGKHSHSGGSALHLENKIYEYNTNANDRGIAEHIGETKNKWTLDIVNTPTIKEGMGVDITQNGVVIGTLQKRLNGAISKILIIANEGVMVETSTDIVVGTTTVVSANIETATNHRFGSCTDVTGTAWLSKTTINNKRKHG